MDNLEQALLESENSLMLLSDEELITPINDILIINPETRLIEVPSTELLLGVFSENLVEKKYFKCPRIVLNNIDLYECFIFINYVSASGRIGSIQSENVELDETEQYILFDWDLTSNVFDKNKDSTIYFSVSAKQYLEDSEPVFATRKAQGKMYETINGTEHVTQEHADIILQILAGMKTKVDLPKDEDGNLLVPEEGQTLLFKEDGTTYYGTLSSGGGTSFSGSAKDVTYDDTETKLGAENVQDAIGKLSEDITIEVEYDFLLLHESDGVNSSYLDVGVDVEVGDVLKCVTPRVNGKNLDDRIDIYTSVDGVDKYQSLEFPIIKDVFGETPITEVELIVEITEEVTSIRVHENTTVYKREEITIGKKVSSIETEFIKVQKEIDDLKNNGTGGSSGTVATVKMSNFLVAGEIIEKPESFSYCGWALNNVQYDKDLNAVMFLYNATVGHSDHDSMTLYLGKLDLKTYDVTLTKIFDKESAGHQVYSCGFVINPKGEYLFLCADAPYLYKSTNKGETWTKISIPVAGFCLTRLDNGRYLYHDWSNYGVYYSDDEGANWTKTNAKKFFEACFVDFKDGRVMAISRKTSYGTSNGSWDGTKQVEPAVISKSEDWGATWTAITDSNTIIEMTADNCCYFYHEDEGLIELFVTSRMTHGDSKGAIFQYIASVEDAWNDNWGTPKVVLYPDCINPQDFGYIGGCKDAKGDMHIMYYDGDSSESGSCNYKYIKASRNQATLPVSKNVTSVFLPYSGVAVDELIKMATAKLQAQIDKLIIQGGGTPEQGGTLDGTSPVYDGLYEYVDFLDESKYEVDTYTYKGYYGKFDIVAGQNKPSEFNTSGLYQTGYQQADLSSDLPFANGVTIELDVYVGEPSFANAQPQIIALGVKNNVYGNPALLCNGKTYVKYNNTSGSTSVEFGSETTFFYTQTNVYHHSVMVLTNEYVKFYMDGTLISTITYADLEDFASLIVDSVGIFSVNGGWGTASNYAKMLRVYNRELTADEVKNNYQYQKAQRI